MTSSTYSNGKESNEKLSNGKLSFGRFSQLAFSRVGSQRQLIFVFNGFQWSAAVASASADGVTLEAVASSNTTDYRAAIAQLVEKLKDQIGRLPKQTSFVHSGVISALLDLPVDAAAARPPQQMQELIRWELENFVADYNDLWTLGAVLSGRGYLDNQQRHDAAVELELRRAAGHGLIRYGEIVIELGSATREQVDECLLLQEKIISHDENMICGWKLQPIVDDDGNESHSWLCCGMSEQKRQQWFSAFKQQGIHLQWLYPLHLVSLPLVVKHLDGDAHGLVLEQHPEQWVSYRVLNGRVAGMRVEASRNEILTSDACANMMSEQLRPGILKIFIYSNAGEGDSGTLQAQLAARLDREVISLKVDKSGDSTVDNHALVALESIAYATLGRNQGESLVKVEAQEPPPPFYKRVDFWRYATPAILILLVLVIEVRGQWQLMDYQRQLVDLNVEYKQKMALNGKVSAMNNEFSQAQKKLEEQRRNLADLNRKNALFTDVLLARSELIPQLLRAVAQSVDDEVVIDKLFEPRRSTSPGFHIQAWSASNTGASNFTRRFDENVRGLSFKVRDVDIRANSGRYPDMFGYSVDFWLVPLPPAELEGDGLDGNDYAEVSNGLRSSS